MRDAVAPPARQIGPVTRTDFVRYQGASGDMNPVHHDDAVASRSGYSSAFAPGMLPAGYMAAWAAEGWGLSRMRHFKVRFIDQLWPGETVRCNGGVQERRTESDGCYLDLWLRCETVDGREIARGEATFLVDPDSDVEST